MVTNYPRTAGGRLPRDDRPSISNQEVSAPRRPVSRTGFSATPFPAETWDGGVFGAGARRSQIRQRSDRRAWSHARPKTCGALGTPQSPSNRDHIAEGEALRRTARFSRGLLITSSWHGRFIRWRREVISVLGSGPSTLRFPLFLHPPARADRARAADGPVQARRAGRSGRFDTPRMAPRTHDPVGTVRTVFSRASRSWSPHMGGGLLPVMGPARLRLAARLRRAMPEAARRSAARAGGPSDYPQACCTSTHHGLSGRRMLREAVESVRGADRVMLGTITGRCRSIRASMSRSSRDSRLRGR